MVNIAEEGVSTRSLCSINRGASIQLSISGILKAAGFCVGDNILIKWKPGEIKITKFSLD